ncbi:MAG: carbonic anhydrase, partial [Gammaproteobacteria bacterium]|nr:carbonic anhydrase [Gammaproteobacteria bacterium]
AQQALDALIEGNRRFVAEVQNHALQSEDARRYRLVPRQDPFAIIIGCSDARVPAEIIFDQGLGDLFVIRVAGNIIAPSQVGSVEFAVERFGTPLVLVLGHSRCGAVEATLEELERPSENRSPNLRAIVDRIRPSVESLLEAGLRLDSDQLVEQAVRANIRSSANQLRHGSEILEQLIEKKEMLVVGAEYSLETGSVDFFDVDH